MNFELKILLNFLDIWNKNRKKKQVIWLKGKSMKNHTSWQEKKSNGKVCLLFWLEICSIIGAYFIPILVLKFQLKISVKTSVKTRGFLSLIFFSFFLLYSRVILGFSLTPSLLLCTFYCLNC